MPAYPNPTHLIFITNLKIRQNFTLIFVAFFFLFCEVFSFLSKELVNSKNYFRELRALLFDFKMNLAH